jgi:hypothetical protein
VSNKPTKQDILDCIAKGLNVWEQAAHFHTSQWMMSKWRKSYGITQKRKQVKKPRPNHNRISPVNLLGSTNFDYAAAVEKDLHRLHERNFPNYPYETFKEGLKSPNGQRWLALHQRQTRKIPVRSSERQSISKSARGGYGGMA